MVTASLATVTKAPPPHPVEFTGGHSYRFCSCFNHDLVFFIIKLTLIKPATSQHVVMSHPLFHHKAYISKAPAAHTIAKHRGSKQQVILEWSRIYFMEKKRFSPTYFLSFSKRQTIQSESNSSQKQCSYNFKQFRALYPKPWKTPQ